MLYEANSDVTYFKCTECHKEYCLKCGVAWHMNQSCEQYKDSLTDNYAIEFAMKNNWKRCPQCQFFVAKEFGCNSMTCRCGCRFCYGCGKRKNGECRCCYGLFG